MRGAMRAPTTTFGATLRDDRRIMEVSLEQLAARSGLDISLLSRLESGERNPTRDSLPRICAALGLGERDRDHLFLIAGFVPPDVPVRALAALLAAYRVAASTEAREEAA